ncbi:MAG: lysyl endopeptidase [Myxococcota bacterium]
MGACGDDGGGGGGAGSESTGGSSVGTSNGPSSSSGGGETSVADTTAGDSGIAEDGTSTGMETGSSDGGPGVVPLGRPAGVFGGGPFYHDAATVMPRMRDSGFDTMILWSVHVHDDGDLVLNDQLIIEDGEYVGVEGWPELVVSLEEEPTTVTRTEFSVGAWGVPDFDNIAMLIEAEGTGPDSILYRNFAALKQVIPTIDAINYDDETYFQANPTIEFSLMLAELDYKVTFAPYNNMGFWTAVYDELEVLEPGLVDRVLLQVYAGGAGNNPANWSAAFDGLEVEAGLWSLHGGGCSQGDTPAEVQTRLEGWSGSTVGGWMWLLDDMLACDPAAPLEDYASAIHAVYGE